MNTTPVILGLMSGTSLDGLDLVAVKFIEEELGYSYEIIASNTVSYDSSWREILRNAHLSSALELSQLNVDFGIYCGKQVKLFCEEFNLRPFAVSTRYL